MYETGFCININPSLSFSRNQADPNDRRTQHQVQEIKPVVPQTDAVEDQLTEEELKFMEEIGEEADSDQDDMEDPDPSAMTEDIADAYEQFLAEQSRNGS